MRSMRPGIDSRAATPEAIASAGSPRPSAQAAAAQTLSRLKSPIRCVRTGIRPVGVSSTAELPSRLPRVAVGRTSAPASRPNVVTVAPLARAASTAAAKPWGTTAQASASRPRSSFSFASR